MHLVTHLNVRTSRTEEGRETGITESQEVCDMYKQLKKCFHPSAHRGPAQRNEQTNKQTNNNNKASRVLKNAWEDRRNKTSISKSLWKSLK